MGCFYSGYQLSGAELMAHSETYVMSQSVAGSVIKGLLEASLILPDIIDVNMRPGEMEVIYDAQPPAEHISEVTNLLNLAVVENHKLRVISDMSERIKEYIVSGFWSSATGQPRFYDSDIEDQINLDGAATAGGFAVITDWIEGMVTQLGTQSVTVDLTGLPSLPTISMIPWTCQEETIPGSGIPSGVKTQVIHTPDQVMLVGFDWMNFKAERIGYFQYIKTLVLSATTLVQIDAYYAAFDPAAPLPT